MPLSPDLLNLAVGVATGNTRIPTSKDEILVAGAGIAGNALGGPVAGFAAEQAVNILLGGDKVSFNNLTDSDTGIMATTTKFAKKKGKDLLNPEEIFSVPTSYSWLPMSQSIIAQYGFDWTQGEGSNPFEEGAIATGQQEIGAAINDSIGTGRLGAGLRDTSGFTPDYKAKVLFQGIPFRTFQWPLIFQPKNEGEAQGIEAWIQDMKLMAAPISGKVYFTNPHLFDLSFFKNGTRLMFNTEKLALTNLEVNYTPNNIWSQHRSGFPTAISVNISFIETVRLTQQNIEAYGL